MTKDKAQKQATRARMAKTGERYTTARHYALDLHHASQAPLVPAPLDERSLEDHLAGLDETANEPIVAPSAALPPRVAEPGMRDAAVQRATGKGWDEWLALLDAWEGTTKTHPEIARHLAEAHGIDGWWAQGITVGYERARGMRALHERPDGFSMNVSKTFPVPAARLFATFMEAEQRERWIEGIALRPRTSQLHRSARFDLLPGEGRLSLTFVAKGAEKSSVQLQQDRLRDVADVAHWKGIWQAQLARLATYLEGDG